MFSHKARKTVALLGLAATTLLTSGVSMSAALDTVETDLRSPVMQFTDDIQSKPYNNHSFGEPSNPAVILQLMGGPLAHFETPIDSEDGNPDISSWTDDQIVDYYQEDWNFTSNWLDAVTERPELVEELGTTAIAKSGGVNHRPNMTATQCMAIGIQGEAGGEGYRGKVLVGKSILFRAGGKASKVCSALFARAQFESMGKRVRSINAESLRAAKEVLNGKKSKCEYDHFINKTLQRKMGRKIPKWVKNFEAWKCRSKKEGLHTFYASCDCKKKR